MTAKTEKTKRAKFKRLYEMGTEYMERLDTLLLKKTPRLEIARVIQDEWGYCTDVKASTLSKQIDRYAVEILPSITGMEEVIAPPAMEGEYHPATPPKADKPKRKKYLDYASETDPDLDVYAEMLKMAKIQSVRVEKIFDREADLPTLMGVVTNEIRTYQNMLKDIAEFQFATGRIHRVPKNKINDMSSELEKRARDAHKEALKKKEQVGKAAHRALEIISSISDDI